MGALTTDGGAGGGDADGAGDGWPGCVLARWATGTPEVLEREEQLKCH